jgi:carbazole 1,9a-dioxygenase terminal dioxygenase component
VTVLGEKILIKRIDGKAYAVKDRCLHRGVRFSEKIECYTKNTLTCWYHGFTYRWDSGDLCDILAQPDSKAINRRKLRTYPVEEAKGLIFVFVGDDGRVPPPLQEDVPPTFLDEDMAIHGAHYMVKSNWRVGAENGFDGLHVYIHRQSGLIAETQRSLPLGHTTAPDTARMHEEEGSPKGVFDDFSGHASVWEGIIEDKVVVKGTRSPGVARRTSGASIWLPGVLRVDNFPDGDITQFEWYVPITEDTHLYIITIGKRVKTPEEATHFEHEFWNRWKPVSLEGFNDQDIMAREAMQKYYGNDRAWLEEGLIEGDQIVLRWRELCHRHHRGLQQPEHTW